jgi:hypothetical protein
MDSASTQRFASAESESEEQKDASSEDGILNKIASSEEKAQDLKLKEVPLVHQSKKKADR